MVGIRNSVWGFRKCLESLWHCNTVPFTAHWGYWFHRENTDCARRILIVYLTGWRVWYRAISSTQQGGCWLCLCKIRRGWQFRIVREFQWQLGLAIVFRRIANWSGICWALPLRYSSAWIRTPSASTLCVLRVGSYNIYFEVYRFMSRISEPLLLSPAPKDKTVLAAGTNQHDVSCVFVFPWYKWSEN